MCRSELATEAASAKTYKEQSVKLAKQVQNVESDWTQVCERVWW